MATGDPKSVALDAIKKAGFPEDQWATALAVATAESGLNPRAVNNKNTNGTSDYGLFQINSIHKPTAAEKTDPYANAKRAYRIWKEAGSKWTPWSAYNNGAYKASLLDPGKVPGVGLVKDGVEGVGNTVDALRDPFGTAKAAVDSALAKLAEFLNLYLMILLGLVLIVIGLVILSRDRVGKIALDMATKGVSKYIRKGAKASKVTKVIGKATE